MSINQKKEKKTTRKKEKELCRVSYGLATPVLLYECFLSEHGRPPEKLTKTQKYCQKSRLSLRNTSLQASKCQPTFNPSHSLFFKYLILKSSL